MLSPGLMLTKANKVILMFNFLFVLVFALFSTLRIATKRSCLGLERLGWLLFDFKGNV